MIVIDSSVFVATIAQEPEAERLNRAWGLRPGASSLPEAMWNAPSSRKRVSTGVRPPTKGGLAPFNDGPRRRRVAMVRVDGEMGEAAADTFRRFGKGRHPAKLNYGDCFAYALARTRALPLLYKGDDFARTDITSALV